MGSHLNSTIFLGDRGHRVLLSCCVDEAAGSRVTYLKCLKDGTLRSSSRSLSSTLEITLGSSLSALVSGAQSPHPSLRCYQKGEPGGKIAHGKERNTREWENYMKHRRNGWRMCLPVTTQFTESCAMTLCLSPSSTTESPSLTAVTLKLKYHGNVSLSLLAVMCPSILSGSQAMMLISAVSHW